MLPAVQNCAWGLHAIVQDDVVLHFRPQLRDFIVTTQMQWCVLASTTCSTKSTGLACSACFRAAFPQISPMPNALAGRVDRLIFAFSEFHEPNAIVCISKRDMQHAEHYLGLQRLLQSTFRLLPDLVAAHCLGRAC